MKTRPKKLIDFISYSNCMFAIEGKGQKQMMRHKAVTDSKISFISDEMIYVWLLAFPTFNLWGSYSFRIIKMEGALAALACPREIYRFMNMSVKLSKFKCGF